MMELGGRQQKAFDVVANLLGWRNSDRKRDHRLRRWPRFYSGTPCYSPL
ncbi:hypothetical protein [uncultured Fretibacterium sp.]|nr:hypothetical protein [uncultured Fretibacterium sp.]